MFIMSMVVTLILCITGTYLYFTRHKRRNKSEELISDSQDIDTSHILGLNYAMVPLFVVLFTFYLEAFVFCNIRSIFLDSGLEIALIMLLSSIGIKNFYKKMIISYYVTYSEQSEDKIAKSDKAIKQMNCEMSNYYVASIIMLLVVLCILVFIKYFVKEKLDILDINIIVKYIFGWLSILLGKFIWFDGVNIKDINIKGYIKSILSKKTLLCIVIIVAGIASSFIKSKIINDIINGVIFGGFLSVICLFIYGLYLVIMDNLRKK